MGLDNAGEAFYNLSHKGGDRYGGLTTSGSVTTVFAAASGSSGCMGLVEVGVMTTILLVAVRMDLSGYRIRNRLILAGLGAGMALRFPTVSADSVRDLLAGILLPVVICWIPFLMHALGAGDIKLFSVIGCLYGGRDAVRCIGYSFLIAAAISLFLLIRMRQLRTSLISCFRYFQQILQERKVMPYPGRDVPGHRFHFSVAVFLGYGVLMGVKVCKAMPL